MHQRETPHFPDSAEEFPPRAPRLDLELSRRWSTRLVSTLSSSARSEARTEVEVSRPLLRST